MIDSYKVFFFTFFPFSHTYFQYTIDNGNMLPYENYEQMSKQQITTESTSQNSDIKINKQINKPKSGGK